MDSRIVGINAAINGTSALIIGAYAAVSTIMTADVLDADTGIDANDQGAGDLDLTVTGASPRHVKAAKRGRIK